MTPLDAAHAAMEAAPEDEHARLRFYDRLAGAELFLLLEAEAEGDRITPRIFPVGGETVVLAFDREDRLARFAEGPAPYASLSGRALARLLSGQGLGLGLNLDVAPSAMLMEAASIAWLAEMLAAAPEEALDRPEEVLPPGGLPEALLTALDAKLAGAEGLARSAYLVGVRYEGGRQGHMLGLIDAVPGAEAGLAEAVSEALTFSGIEAGELDVAFFAASDPMAARLARVGLRFDLPRPPPAVSVGAAPGMDPETPPKLR